jgi:hypothetical protein
MTCQLKHSNALKYQVIDMNYRPVLIRPITQIDLTAHPEFNKCADCSKPAKQLVFELNGETWAWCGICDIGGV